MSTIPAGTGKSTTLQAFASALCLIGGPSYAPVGMLIACHRVEEVVAMAEALQDHRSSLCVIVGKANTAALAMGDHTTANGAQIVLTTQAALKMTLRGQPDFNEATRYHYQGQRRAVVCWDEAIAFNRPVVIDTDTIGGLARLMRAQSGEAAGELHRWVGKLSDAPEGSCAVPDFEALGVDFRRLEDEAGDSDDLAALAKALRDLSGDIGWLHRSNSNFGAAVITHTREIPNSVLPVIVTDASAALEVRGGAYEQMGTTLPIKYMTSAPKSYGNLRLLTVPLAASRSVFKERTGTKAQDLIDMTVRYIRRVAPDQVLIVTYGNKMIMKGIEQKTIGDAIDARLTDLEKGRVRHVTWGRHTATNDFKDFTRVVLLGLNFLPPSASYAASAAALGKTMRTQEETDHPSTAQVAQMRLGTLRDATFQALLRGSARKSLQTGDCGIMEAVIFQSGITGLNDADYLGMFPGASINVDHTLLPVMALKGKMMTLSRNIMRRIDGDITEVAHKELREELGMPAKDFRELVSRPQWKAWLDKHGLIKTNLKGKHIGVRKVA